MQDVIGRHLLLFEQHHQYRHQQRAAAYAQHAGEEAGDGAEGETGEDKVEAGEEIRYQHHGAAQKALSEHSRRPCGKSGVA